MNGYGKGAIARKDIWNTNGWTPSDSERIMVNVSKLVARKVRAKWDWEDRISARGWNARKVKERKVSNSLRWVFSSRVVPPSHNFLIFIFSLSLCSLLSRALSHSIQWDKRNLHSFMNCSKLSTRLWTHEWKLQITRKLYFKSLKAIWYNLQFARSLGHTCI